MPTFSLSSTESVLWWPDGRVEPSCHHKMVSIGKVVDGFNLATSSSNDVWMLEKVAIWQQGALIKCLLIVPSITQGLNHLVS